MINQEDLINKVNLMAPIKFILKTNKNEQELLNMYNEIVQELSKFNVSKKIEFLEKKLINDMTEENFKELLELKKQVNGS